MLFWLGLLLTALPALILTIWLGLMYLYLRWKYAGHIARIFQEKPLFIVPRGRPVFDAEDVQFPTQGGLMLRGCYLSGRGPRRGVILFGLEFGSNRWSCRAYCQALLDHGYDVFAFESRNQGDSERLPGYEPLQWVTEYEVEDTLAALAYLRSREDASPDGVGLFGISKGAGAGLIAASRDPYLRCFVTDGMFATYTTLVPYMRMWFRIYNSNYFFHGLMPSCYYGLVGLSALERIEAERRCKFPSLERALGRLDGRPLLMIHGGGDTYIKPDMALDLFDRVKGPKELWMVEGAKHNQSLQVAGGEYVRRVLEFFDRHLAQAGQTEPRSPGRSRETPVRPVYAVAGRRAASQ